MDTFYIEGSGGHLLRTHTSPMQIRTMEKQPPPVRIIVPGKVYRRDNPDATHGYMFHQIEGLAVDTDITFCDFRGTVEYFVREFLGAKVKTRLRPSYFPFTEPSAEVDATCLVCGGEGCRMCKFSGWIEMFGAGMVNPAVYGFVNYDPKRLSGFAFGMGVDRLAMMQLRHRRICSCCSRTMCASCASFREARHMYVGRELSQGLKRATEKQLSSRIPFRGEESAFFLGAL